MPCCVLPIATQTLNKNFLLFHCDPVYGLNKIRKPLVSHRNCSPSRKKCHTATARGGGHLFLTHPTSATFPEGRVTTDLKQYQEEPCVQGVELGQLSLCNMTRCFGAASEQLSLCNMTRKPLHRKKILHDAMKISCAATKT